MPECPYCETPHDEGIDPDDCCHGAELKTVLREAVDLLDNATCDLRDPALRRAWGRRRKALRDRVGSRGVAGTLPPHDTQ